MQSRADDNDTIVTTRTELSHNRMASFSAKQIIGSNVYDDHNRELGMIHDIMLSIGGNIAYIVLSYGGVFGTTLGDKRFAIPFDAFTIQHQDGDLEFTLMVDKSILENAPGFDKDYMPNFADPTFASQIDKYYKEYSAKDMTV